MRSLALCSLSRLPPRICTLALRSDLPSRRRSFLNKLRRNLRLVQVVSHARFCGGHAVVDLVVDRLHDIFLRNRYAARDLLVTFVEKLLGSDFHTLLAAVGQVRPNALLRRFDQSFDVHLRHQKT